MRLKISLKPPVFIGSIATVIFSVIIIFLPNFNRPVQGSDMKLPALLSTIPVKPVIGLPVRLQIPKLKVNASVENVGLTKDKSMGAPKIPSDVAWFNLGVRPGEIGSAVMAGHVNWYSGATAVFANLNKLKPGDKIFVKDNNGVTISFVVRKVRVYSIKDDTSEVFSADDDLAHLNLITCVGVWNKRSKQYSQRLVVFTDRE
ncbi:MAG TPA: class F sortase [Candidatus Udaeobacter sp.]|nr:class F sortase [Candidatus Udaeobacter sp.]